MADSKRQLILELLGVDKTKAATKAAADNLEDVAAAATEAAVATEALGKESDKAEDQVERFGKSGKTAAEHMAALDAEIEITKEELKQLAVSFAEADTAAERMDLSKGIRKTQADLRKLNTSKGLLEDLAPSTEALDDASRATEDFGKAAEKSWEQAGRLGVGAEDAAAHVKRLDGEIDSAKSKLGALAAAFAAAQTEAERLDISKSIQRVQGELGKLNLSKGLLADLVPPKQTGSQIAKNIVEGLAGAKGEIAAGAAAALAPSIAGVLAGAVIGGSGLLGIVGGLALVAKDPAIKSYASQIGKTFSTGVSAEAKSAFLVPATQALDQVSAFVDRSIPKIGEIFDATAPSVNKLTSSLLGAGDALLNGITADAKKSGPVIDALGGLVDHTAVSVEHLMDVFADHSDEAAASLKELDSGLQSVLTIASSVVDVMLKLKGAEDTLDAWAAKGSLLGKVFQGLKDAMPDQQIEHFGDLLGKLSGPTTTLTKVSGGLGDSQSRLATQLLSAGEAAGQAGMNMETYADKMDEASAKGRGLYDSQTAVAQALADTGKAAKENGKTLDINTQKGRDNRTALSNLAGALTANYDAYVKLNGEGKAAQGIAEQDRSQFVKLAGQFGLSKKAAGDLATEMGLIPANKSTTFHANTHDAAARVEALREKIGAVNSKTVTIKVIQSISEKVNNQLDKLSARAIGGPVKKNKAYVVGEKRAEVFVPDQDGQIIPSVDQYQHAGGGSGRSSGGAAAMTLTIDTRGADSIMGQAIVKMLRTQPAVAAQIKKILA